MPPSVVTIALRFPDPVGRMLKLTVNWVEVAAVTLPMAPKVVNATVLLLAVVSKPVPLMTTVVALIGRFAVLAVTVGAATMFAT